MKRKENDRKDDRCYRTHDAARYVRDSFMEEGVLPSTRTFGGWTNGRIRAENVETQSPGRKGRLGRDHFRNYRQYDAYTMILLPARIPLMTTRYPHRRHERGY